jgi:hypothetical protein
MNDTKNLDAILEELYTADPELRSQDVPLRKLAVELMAAKPDAPLDAVFVARLRDELSLRASTKKQPSGFFAKLFASPSTMYLVPGLALAALVMIVSIKGSPIRTSAPKSPELAMATGVERLGAHAFGELTAQPSGAGEQASDAATSLNSARSSAPMTAPAPTGDPGGLPPFAGGTPTSDAKMIVPRDWTPTYYNYVYKGEPLEGLASSVDVYRRTKVAVDKGPVDALRGSDLGLIDLGRLKAGSLQSFTIVEDRKDGYVVSVNPEEGTINVYENSKWSYPERQCTDQACIDSYRLKESDMLKDDETIRIADAFLTELGVSKKGYGPPVVHDDWHVSYLAASDKAGYFFPDTFTVVYPYLIYGKSATDESGSAYGLNVNVNIAHKRATSLWNLTAARFQSSPYEAETDAKKLLAVAERGGLQGGGMTMENAKIVEVELGTPSVSYSRVWQWNEEGGTELFAPTLVFPVLHPPQDFWQTNVTVPLAKDLLKTALEQPVPVPMPMELQKK